MSWGLVERIGSGSLADVYRAVAPDGQTVALKCLKARDDTSRKLFEEQARLLLRLRHPALVRVLGFLPDSSEIFGENRGSCFWMELVQARDLITASRGVDKERVMTWFREAVDALDALHAQGVIHGDLSPSNLAVDDRGHLKILDFSALPGDASWGDVVTLPYMAPERLNGHPSAASDLFSLGTIFYEAFSGRHPRSGCRTMTELIRKEPSPLSLPDPIAARIIDRMIVADPVNRFATAAAVKKALEGVFEEAAVIANCDFYPLVLEGAESAQAVIREAMTHALQESLVLAVHGPAGTGKTRLIHEAAFEGALRGLRVQDYQGVHRLDAEALGPLLGAIRSLPPSGAILFLEWDDEAVAEDRRRFFDTLLKEVNVREAALRPLDRLQCRCLLEGFLSQESLAAFLDAVFDASRGNPGVLLSQLRLLARVEKLRDRTLLPGWKDLLENRKGEVEPEEAVERSRYLRRMINRLNAQGRFGEALNVADRWMSLESDDEPAPLKTVKYWWITGWGCHNLGRVEESEQRLRRCLQEGRDHQDNAEIATLLARSRSLLGLSALARGDLPGSRAEFETALSLQPQRDSARAETLRNLARAEASSGQREKSLTLLQEAKSIYRESERDEGLFWTVLQEGNLKLEDKAYEEASRAYDEAETLAKKTGSDLRLSIVWNNRGLLERERRRYLEALELLRKAYETLRFLGNANDVAHNLKELSVAEACVGRWAQAEKYLRELKAMEASFAEAGSFARLAQEAVDDLRLGKKPESKATLQTLYENLPPELQVSFVDRGDWRRLFSMPAIQEVPMVPTPKLHDVLTSLTRLNQALLAADQVPGVLEKLMDAAMELAKAENGFLVLRSEDSDGPLPGFDVAVARNVEKKELQTDLYTFSLSAVRRAVQTGEPVVTDNAVLDPDFREARSVHLRQLKSLVALPVKGQDEILGVFYLDHRFEEGLFEGDLLATLQAFASVAALALQKGKMIEALSANNRDLMAQVRAQTRELGRSRMILKNEYSDIVGRSPKMVEVLSLVDRITDAKVPVWIFGESGTGKEAVARSLHFNSPRAKKPFVTENCGALPESLLESELFGHKKGAFTHAVSDKKGILQYADGGTIFLDEIADMSLALQAKLLRFLQEGEIRPIGSTEVVRVDVRVVSASNKDLAALVSEGKFREDLFYRLNGVTVKLPPLRERMEDLPLLTEHFLKKHNVRLEPDALRVFMNYAWPGNIRELQNTIETAVLFAENGAITIKSLQFKPLLFQSLQPSVTQRPSSGPQVAMVLSQPALPPDPVLIETLRAIRDNAYHKGYAAEALGITRRALYARLQRFGLAMDVKSLKEKIEMLAIP